MIITYKKRTEVHGEYDYFNADYGLTFAQYLQIMTSLKPWKGSDKALRKHTHRLLP